MELKYCPLTNLSLHSNRAIVNPTTRAALEYEFEPIGRAHITDVAIAELHQVDESIKAKLAGICRNAFENKEEPIEVTSAFIANLQDYKTPSTVRAKSNHLLKYMYDRGGNDYEAFSFSSAFDYPLVYAIDAGEFNKIMKHLEAQGFIKIGNEIGMAGHLVVYEEVSMTDAGINQVENEILASAQNSLPTPQPMNTVKSKEQVIDIFISHSSHDVPIVKALIELLRSALNVPADKIRCSSVEGYKFPGGVTTDDEIKREVFEARVLLGVISPTSVNSMYVVFELGARWGIKKPLVPLTTSKVGIELLKGPLKGINALNSTVRTDVLQLINDLGNYIGIEPQQPAVYDDKVTKLVELSLAETLPSEEEAKLNDKIADGISTDEYHDAEAIIKQHCTSYWPDDYTMQRHCIGEQRAALKKLKDGKPKDIPQDVFLQIRRKATADWPTDFVMREHAESEQISAYRELHEE